MLRGSRPACSAFSRRTAAYSANLLARDEGEVEESEPDAQVAGVFRRQEVVEAFGLGGKDGAAKRIDVMAAGIWNEMTVEEFAMLDLSYAPPFGPLWDPVALAARKVSDLIIG